MWMKKKRKIRRKLKRTVGNVIPFNFPVIALNQTCICNDGK